MFEDEVHVKKKNDFRYGTTKKPAYETMNEIMDLLDEYGCERVMTDRKGESMRIGFIFEGRPYKIQIPKVYVNGKYNEKIGIRVVYHFLKIVLSWSKQGIVSMERALMSGRMVQIGNRTLSLGEAAEELDDGDLSSTLGKHLPPKREYEDAEYEVIE